MIAVKCNDCKEKADRVVKITLNWKVTCDACSKRFCCQSAYVNQHLDDFFIISCPEIIVVFTRKLFHSDISVSTLFFNLIILWYPVLTSLLSTGLVSAPYAGREQSSAWLWEQECINRFICSLVWIMYLITLAGVVFCQSDDVVHF